MTTLCLSAVKLELAWLLDSLVRPERLKVPGVKLWSGQIGGRPVLMAACGIGPQSARGALERLGSRFEFARVVHFGVCGALSTGPEICRPVLARRIQAAWEPGLEPYEFEPPPAGFFDSLSPEVRPISGRTWMRRKRNVGRP